MRTILGALPLIAQLLTFPLVWVLVDSVGAVRGLRSVSAVAAPKAEISDFTVLVPIYGSVEYLRNLDWLRDYPGQVWLLTTTGETAEFTAQLAAIAADEGFSVFSTRVPGRRAGRSRATSGATRDTLVRDALEHVTTNYVVCLDADTTTARPLGELVSLMDTDRLDFASLRIVPTNTDRWLGKLQEYEYRVAMRLRVLAPWMVSGACHAARTVAHREIMRHHSLFFQGNDVEAGILAGLLGYRVGHIQIDVSTDVPDTVRSWLRQRLAWTGGEFRLFAVNAHLIRRHVWLWSYGTLLVLMALPLRWRSITELAWSLIITYVLYLAVSLVVHRGRLNCWVLAMPLYAAFSSLVMTPLGIGWYFVMAIRDRNIGVIRLRRPVATSGTPQHARQ